MSSLLKKYFLKEPLLGLLLVCLCVVKMTTAEPEEQEYQILNSKATDPVLIVSGKELQFSLGVQITISIFLVIAYFDFIFQSVLILYVFIQIIISYSKCSDIFFALFGITIFVILRCSFLPFLILPIPWDWAPTIPDLLMKVTTYISMATFVFFYGLAALACIYFVIFVGVTGKKMTGSIIDSKTGIEPMVIILMPIYNEEPDALFRAVESAVRCNYRPDRLHVFLAFDEVSETSLYFALLKKLHVLSKEVSDEIKSKLEIIDKDDIHNGEPIQIFPPRLEWYIEGVRVTICRFPHEGKSPTQGKSYKVINEMYGQNDETAANTLILFIDSDIILHENSIHNFVATAVANPKIKGMTGLVTCRTSRRFNIYQYMQDSEYIDGQMFSRTAESSLGAVTCLPGALTLIRLNALQKVAPKYFIEIDKRRTVDFHRYHLGEDRYMTYLLTEEATGPYQVRYISNATCKTDAPDTFQKLLKQRRRWFLGGFVNDMSTICSRVMWQKVPFVTLMKIHFYSSKGMDWILPIIIITLALDKNPGLALYFLAATFIIRYVLLCINALIMTRNKVCVSYIFLFILSPIFNWMVTIYAIWTWNTRSWGGPRTDSDKEEISKIQVLDEVMAQKEEGIGKTRKILGQIKTISRIIENNLRQNDPFGSMRSTRSTRSTKSTASNSKLQGAPVKKFVPFPYQTEFLGGGNYDDTILIPPSPSLSTKSLRPPKLISGRGGLEPQYLTSSNLGLHPSSSMPDLKTLSDSNAPYLFAKLSPETQRRSSSFRLDIDYLAKVEGLATLQNSDKKDSSFNIRISGRTSPMMGSSREPSVLNLDVTGSKASSLSGSEVPGDISIHVSDVDY